MSWNTSLHCIVLAALLIVVVSGWHLLAGNPLLDTAGFARALLAHGMSAGALMLAIGVLARSREIGTDPMDRVPGSTRWPESGIHFEIFGWLAGGAALTGVVLYLGAPRSSYMSSAVIGALHEILALATVLVLVIRVLSLLVAGALRRVSGMRGAGRSNAIGRRRSILARFGRDRRGRLPAPQCLAAYLVGCILFSLGVKLFIDAGLGADPFHALAVGTADRSAMPIVSIGFAAGCITLLLLALWFLITKTLPPLSTFLTMVLVGYLIDLWNLVGLERLWVADAGAWPIMLAGLFLDAYGSALIIISGIGIRTVDLVAVALMRRFGLRFFQSKLLLEGSLAAGGWLLGGPVGIATVAFVATVGPFVEPLIQLNMRCLGLANRGFEAPEQVHLGSP